MREEIYEESSSTKNYRMASVRYNTCSTLSWISFAVAIFWTIQMLLLLDLDKGIINIILGILPIVLFIGAGIVLNVLKKKFYVDYDYAIVSGSIRFSKVIKNKQRRFIAAFDAKEIDHIGKLGSDICKKYLNMADVKKIVLTSNTVPSDGCDFYYIVAVVKGERTMFILDCTRRFLSVILQFARRGVLEEGT